MHALSQPHSPNQSSNSIGAISMWLVQFIFMSTVNEANVRKFLLDFKISKWNDKRNMAMPSQKWNSRPDLSNQTPTETVSQTIPGLGSHQLHRSSAKLQNIQCVHSFLALACKLPEASSVIRRKFKYKTTKNIHVIVQKDVFLYLSLTNI